MNAVFNIRFAFASVSSRLLSVFSQDIVLRVLLTSLFLFCKEISIIIYSFEINQQFLRWLKVLLLHMKILRCLLRDIFVVQPIKNTIKNRRTTSTSIFIVFLYFAKLKLLNWIKGYRPLWGFWNCKIDVKLGFLLIEKMERSSLDYVAYGSTCSTSIRRFFS